VLHGGVRGSQVHATGAAGGCAGADGRARVGAGRSNRAVGAGKNGKLTGRGSSNHRQPCSWL
jgi:hypothetical protein